MTEIAKRVNDYALRLALLLPITTLFQSYELLSWINQAVVVFFVVMLFASYLVTKYPIGYWLLIAAAVISTAVSWHETGGALRSINDITYLPLWIMLLLFSSATLKSKDDLIIRNLNWIKWVVFAWSAIVLVSAFLPSSYYSSWGEGVYFASFTSGTFRLAPTAFLILSLLMACVVHEKNNRMLYFLLSLIPLYCAFMGGSRIYLFVILLCYIFFLKYFSKNPTEFKILITIGALLSLALIGVSAIGEKIASTAYTNESYYDFWGTLTNSRSVFWTADIMAYSKLDVFHKFFGMGFNYVYEVNAIAVNSAIWAHNDFINILLANGLFGLVLYLVPIIILIKEFSTGLLPNKKLLVGIFVIIWAGNAFFNMEYTYICAALATCLIPLLVTYSESRRDREKTIDPTARNQTNHIAVSHVSNARKCFSAR